VTESTGSRTPPPVVAPVARRSFGRGTRWIVFVALAATVVVLDQLAKAAVTSALDPGESVPVLGDLVRIVFGQNTGALFGLFQDNAAMFGVVSLVVIGLIVAYHARAAVSPYLTVTLGLLLGGAIGNMLDRIRLGYVVDFVDAGIGTLRFYTFNVADSAISLSILLLFIAAIRPSLVEGGETPPATPPARPKAATPFREGDEDPWDEDPAR
jgi:signal peptidase II